MTDILAQVGTKIGSEIKNLDIRLSSAETAIVNLGGSQPPPTGNFTINPVSWTNLSEINLSGEKILNGDFSQLGYAQDPSYALPTSPNGNHNTHYTFASGDRPLVIALKSIDGMTEGEVYEMHRYHVGNGKANIEITSGNLVWISYRGVNWEVVEHTPANWEVRNGSLNQTKLAQGIIKGSGGAVSIEQIFPQNISQGTQLIIKVDSSDDIRFYPIKSNGQVDANNDFTVLGANDFFTYTAPINVFGFKISTINGLREFSSVSIFQGVVSGGSVQVNGNGGLQKISGANGWNAGASSTNFIDGNKNGYVQFQWAKNALEVGLTYLDDDYAQNINPFFIRIYVSGKVTASGNFDEDNFATMGDFFRIRHYSTLNEIHFQKKQEVYSYFSGTPLVGMKVKILRTSLSSGNAWADPQKNYWTITSIESDGVYVEASDGTSGLLDYDWRQGTSSNPFWQIVENIGMDYVTFKVANNLTNGDNLFVDTSLYHINSQINDVLLAKQNN